MVKLATPEEAAVKKATRAAYGETLIELFEEGMPIVAVDADPIADIDEMTRVTFVMKDGKVYKQ